MSGNKKRSFVSVSVIRRTWQTAAEEGELSGLGLGARLIENITDDYDGLRLCWCCGKQGYQERAHIVPHSLGGTDDPGNLFLLCSVCHSQAPDTVSPAWFFKWISAEADRHVLEDADFLQVLKAGLLEGLDGAGAGDIDAFGEAFKGQFKAMMASTASHGADLIKSSKQWAMLAAMCAAFEEVKGPHRLQ